MLLVEAIELSNGVHSLRSRATLLGRSLWEDSGDFVRPRPFSGYRCDGLGDPCGVVGVLRVAGCWG